MLSITSHQGRSNHDHSEVLHNFLRKDIITNTGNKNSLEGKREVRIVVHCCWKHKEMLWNVQMWQNMAKTNVASFHMVKHGEYCMNLQFCSCVHTSGNGASPSHVNRWLVCRVNLRSNQEVVGYLLYIHVRIAPVYSASPIIIVMLPRSTAEWDLSILFSPSHVRVLSALWKAANREEASR